MLISVILFLTIVTVWAIPNSTSDPSASLRGLSIGDPKVTLDYPLMISYTSAPVLSVIYSSIDTNYAMQVSSSVPFNMNDKLEVHTTNWQNGITEIYVVPEGTAVIECGTTMMRFFPNGAFRYLTEGWCGYDHKPALPTKEDAKIIADEYLLALSKSTAFYPHAPLELLFVDVVEGSGSTMDGVSWTNYWLVYYELRYNGTPIIGHSGISIWVGDQGKIIGVDAELWNVKLGNQVMINVPLEEAYEQFKSTILSTNDMAEIIVKNITIGYYADKPVLYETNAIMPAYIFTCAVVFTDGTNQLVQVPILATK